MSFFHIHKQNQSKLNPMAEKCVFLGYSPRKKGYKCFVSMEDTFFKNQPYFTKNTLQGENNEREGHFWKVSASLLLPTSSSLNSSWSDPNSIGSNIINYEKSLTGGETLPRKPQSELRIYSGRKNHQYKEH